MADKAISELISADQITASDMFVLEQNGTAKKLTGQVLLNWLTAAADGHGGIQSIVKLGTSGLVDTYRITMADTTTFDFTVNNGRGVDSIVKAGTSGLVDTYAINYNDGTQGSFAVTNGAKGDKGDNQYVWIKYASQEPTASSHSFGDVPDNWIGVYSGASATAPTDWTQYQWFQIKGEEGDTGAAATLTSSSVVYQVGDSGTIIPSGEWVSSVPVVAQGKYLWTRITNTFNSGSPVVAYTVSRMGIDGLGSVVSVCGISPDDTGNVPLDASDLKALPISGGTMEGAVNMNGQTLNGLNAPTEETEAATKGYVDNQVSKAAPRNLLDNSDFRNPVNQRGLMEYSANGYGIDRWASITGPTTVKVCDGYVRVVAPTNNIGRFRQTFETGVVKLGRAYTLAVKLVNETVKISHGVFNDNGSLMCDVSSTLGFYVSLYSENGTNIFVQFGVQSGKSIELEWIALYEGEYTIDTLPEYQPNGYGAELMECMRYFVRFGNTQQNNHIGYAQAATTTVANGILAIPVPMRIQLPSVTVVGKVVLRHGVTDIEISSANVNSAASGPFIYVTLNASGLTAGDFYPLRLAAGTLDFSADL